MISFMFQGTAAIGGGILGGRFAARRCQIPSFVKTAISRCEDPISAAFYFTIAEIALSSGIGGAAALKASGKLVKTASQLKDQNETFQSIIQKFKTTVRPKTS